MRSELERNEGFVLLTPLEIHNKDFKRGFRGYNEDEVDDFLDQVVNDYEQLFRENEKMKEEIERGKKDLVQYQQLEQNLKDTLIVAQRTAEEVTSNARKKTDELYAKAEEDRQRKREQTQAECQMMRSAVDKECQTIKENVMKECDALRAKAEEDAKKRIEDSLQMSRKVVMEYERLMSEKNQYLMKLRVSLEQELSLVNQAMDTLPKPNKEQVKVENIPPVKKLEGYTQLLHKEQQKNEVTEQSAVPAQTEVTQDTIRLEGQE